MTKGLRIAFFVAAFVGACTQQVEVGSKASVVVGPEGGSFSFGDLTLTVPAGALATPVTLSVTSTPSAPSGLRVDGLVYRFEPAGTRFALPIDVTFPTGASGEKVFWTVEGSDDTFRSLDTTVRDGRATAHPTHFSLGFVGSGPVVDAEADASPDIVPDAGDASTDVRCEVKRRAEAGGACTQVTNLETDVAFWLVPHDGDPEGALATSSEGIRAFYATLTPNAPIFRATDATHALYTAPGATAERRGDTVVFTMTASRGGVTSSPACEAIPLIQVTCSGQESLLPSAPLSSDGGSSTDASTDDAGSDADAATADGGPGDTGVDDASDAQATGDATASLDGAVEASPDGGADATTGVTCLSKQRYSTPTSCVQLESVEPHVHFWLVYDKSGIDPEGGLATDSQALKLLFNNTWDDAPLWNATDATNTVYTAYFGVGTRSGSSLSFTLDGSRSGSEPSALCLGIPLIEVHCSGTTTLGR